MYFGKINNWIELNPELGWETLILIIFCDLKMKKFLRKTLYMSANLPAYNTDREIGFDIFGKQPLTQQLSRGEICVENFIPPL